MLLKRLQHIFVFPLVYGFRGRSVLGSSNFVATGTESFGHAPKVPAVAVEGPVANASEKKTVLT
jgi:hypothetical protein